MGGVSSIQVFLLDFLTFFNFAKPLKHFTDREMQWSKYLVKFLFMINTSDSKSCNYVHCLWLSKLL